MESEQVIKEANEYIDRLERGYNLFRPWIAWAVIAISLAIIGAYFYQNDQSRAKLRLANVEVDKTIDAIEGNKDLSTALNMKLDLARADIKIRDTGIYTSGMVLVAPGILGLFIRKHGQRQVKLLRGLLQLIEKNS